MQLSFKDVTWRQQTSFRLASHWWELIQWLYLTTGRLGYVVFRDTVICLPKTWGLLLLKERKERWILGDNWQYLSSQKASWLMLRNNCLSLYSL